jgi:parallel beta-helix repeat protein
MNRRTFLNLMGLGWLASGSTTTIAAVLAQRSHKQGSDYAQTNGSDSIVFYLAPNGNDAWSGKEAKPNRTKTDGPFATFERVRSAIRELKSEQDGNLKQPVNVFVRGGTYFLSNPLLFNSEDSGTVDFPITYAAYKNEKPVISGGKEITGWQAVNINGKNLWKTTIPKVKSGEWFFRELWINGKRRIRARYPKQGYLQVAEVPDVQPQTPWYQGQPRFRFKTGDLEAWSTLKDAELVVMTRWVESRLPIINIDEQEKIVSFGKRSVFRIAPGDLYYIEHAFEILSEPGEWYLEQKTGNLYYIPQPDEEMNRAEVIAPLLSRLVDFQGQPENQEFVEHIGFQNLTFAHTEWYYPPDFRGGWPKPTNVNGFKQAAYGVPGAIYGEGVRYCSWNNCQIAHMGNYGIEFSRGCQDNKLVECDIFDLGAGGVKVDNEAGGIHVINSHIHNGGLMFHSAVGILIQNSPDNYIAYNHIHDFYYTGISVGWTWTYAETATKNNIIEFNHVHHLGLRSDGDGPLLNDKGGIYVLGVQPGTVIRSNIFHDIHSFNFGGWGIYLDQSSSQIVIEKNLVYRTRDGGFHIHYGKDNVVRNNIFALGENAQIRRSKPEAHLSFTFENNIIYWEEGKLFQGNLNNLNFNFDRNLYWHVDNSEIIFGKMSWQEWQSKGMDLNSLVADPLFVDPDNDDFRLKPNSPAFEIGFEAI